MESTYSSLSSYHKTHFILSTQNKKRIIFSLALLVSVESFLLFLGFKEDNEQMRQQQLTQKSKSTNVYAQNLIQRTVPVTLSYV